MAGDQNARKDAPVEAAFDNQIAEDIRSLRRSSQIFAMLGLFAVVLLAMLILVSLQNRHDTRPFSSAEVGIIQAQRVQLMSDPNASSTVVGSLEKGTAVFVQEHKPDWLRVSRDDHEGWIPLASIHIRKAGKDQTSPTELTAGSSDRAPVRMADVNWVVESSGDYSVTGVVVNDSDSAVKNVKLTVLFYDDKGILAGTKSEVLDVAEPLSVGERRAFRIAGRYESRFKIADYRVETWP